MRTLDDRLSRIAALGPPRARAAPGAAPRDGDEVARLIGGTVERNPRGSHVLVRRFFDTPGPPGPSRRALDLLEPGHPEAARDPGQWLFLDTETTGLSGGTGTYAFLVGVGWWECGRFVVEQYFMRDHSEEPSLLAGVLGRLRRRPVLVTYNGKSFDWPLLETRFRMTRTAPGAGPLAHLDLLHPARRLWRHQLDSVALTRLETDVLGFRRGGDIPSETIPRIYFDFLRGGSHEGIADVLNHNRMDLRGLALLALRILDILADPEGSGCGAPELFGVSRLLAKRGDASGAERLGRLALARGLPEEAARMARRDLAVAARRRRDFGESNALWETLLGETAEGLRAYEQLAIHCEHRLGDPARAAAISREALARLQEAYRAGRLAPSGYMRLHAGFRRRLDRLASKLGPGT